MVTGCFKRPFPGIGIAVAIFAGIVVAEGVVKIATGKIYLVHHLFLERYVVLGMLCNVVLDACYVDDECRDSQASLRTMHSVVLVRFLEETCSTHQLP